MEIRNAFILLLLILTGAASAQSYNISSNVFDTGAVLNGTSGGLYGVETEMGLISGFSSSLNYNGLNGLFLYISNNTQSFNLTTNITYPVNGSTFGPAQCWLLTNFTTNLQGGAGSIYLWVNNGTMAIPNWSLVSSVAITGDTVVNWTNLPIDSDYIVNSTYVYGGVTSNAGPNIFWLVGIGLCPSHSSDTIDWGTAALLILGSGLLVYGIYTW